MFRLFECCALSFFERFVLSFSLKIERFVSDSAEIWICGLYITTGLPATVNYQGKRYPLRITKVVPEVKDRMFDVDLVFTGEMPENVRVGKSFRVQIELGQPEQAIVIPRGNFYQSTGGQWIYKINPSKTKAVKVPLNIGRQNPLQYEITEGLQPGEFVIITGYDTFGDAEELILK